MMFELQPDILVNNRNLLPGDFLTPEQRIAASGNGAARESCMTLNESWGYDSADNEWKSSRTIVRNLIFCARDGGNYLLNIGPRGDGSVPEEPMRVLTEVGRWLSANGETIYKAEPCQVRRSAYANFTRIGNTLFMHVYCWPGGDVALSGLRTKVKTARFFRSNEKIKFSQSEYRVHLVGLPIEAPDSPATTIALECESEPTEDSDAELRFEKPRAGVGVEA
jgi:alpha-L-fucosidase